jgi:hypothetical protein
MTDKADDKNVTPGQDADKNSDNKGNDTNQQIDLAKLPADQLEKVLENPNLWKLGRIDQLMKKAKKVDDIEAKEQKDKEAKLLEDKKYQELIAEKDKQITDLQGKIKSTQMDSAIVAAATKAGAIDPQAVLKLIDRSKIAEGENGITGVDEAVKALLDTSTYLKGDGKQVKLGSATTPGADAQAVKKYKLSQYNDNKFYMENKADMDKAAKIGLVEDDLVPAS